MRSLALHFKSPAERVALKMTVLSKINVTQLCFVLEPLVQNADRRKIYGFLMRALCGKLLPVKNLFLIGFLIFWMESAVAVNADANAGSDCDTPFISFNQTLQYVQSELRGVDVVFVNADFFEDPDDICSAVWIVELLTPEDNFEVLVLDATNLLLLREFPKYALVSFGDNDTDQTSVDLEIEQIFVLGTDERDLLEGEWSDDISEGGLSRDSFFLTPGRDVILDFQPGEDVLDMTNFIFSDFEFPVLSTPQEVLRASRIVERDGVFGAEIDLDGDAGDWSVFLEGVNPRDLSAEDIIFPSDAEPRFPPVNQAERRILLSDGSIVKIPARGLWLDPVDPVLESGTPEALSLVQRLFFFDGIKPELD